MVLLSCAQPQPTHYEASQRFCSLCFDRSQRDPAASRHRHIEPAVSGPRRFAAKASPCRSGARLIREKVTVEFAGQSVATVAAADGKWLVRLAPLSTGAALAHSYRENKIVVTDLLVGEVWIASGQSNMERQLGLRAGQQPITGWEAEVAAANYPAIRHFGVAQAKALAPQQTVKGAWAVCTPGDREGFHRRRLFLRARSAPRAARADWFDSQFRAALRRKRGPAKQPCGRCQILPNHSRP